MAKTVLICGKLFDGIGDALRGHMEALIEGDALADISGAVGRPKGARAIELGDRTITPGFIDTHVHLCADGLNLRQQTLQCSAVKALAGLHFAQQYMRYGLPRCGTWGPSIPIGRRWTRPRRRSGASPATRKAACGMFPFSHDPLEFQAMMAAGLTAACALRAAAGAAAELLQRDELGVLTPGKQADIAATPGDPLADTSATAEVDFVMRAGRVSRHGPYDILQ